MVKGHSMIKQLPTVYNFCVIWPRQHFKGQGSMARPQHIVGPLHCLTNVPTKGQLPTSYCYQDTALKRFKDQGHYSKVKG